MNPPLYMRALNFKWSSGIYLIAESHELDLHNLYSFMSVHHNVIDRTLSLIWRRGSVDGSHPKEVKIIISGVYYLRISPRNPQQPFTEDDCLNGFGYDCYESWAKGQFWTESEPDPSWHWSFKFMSGSAIVVGGEEAGVYFEPLNAQSTS